MTAPITKEIKFHESMGFDERDNRFAQLRKNMLDKIGMFPSAEWENEYLSNSFEPDMLIAGNGLWAIGRDSSHDVAFYQISTGSMLSESFKGGHSSDDWMDAKFYYNGTNEMIYGIDDSGDVSAWDTDAKTYTHDVHTSFASGGDKLMGYNTSTDNLYYITGNNLYKQDQTTFSSSLKALSDNYSYKDIIDFEDWIVIIGESNSGDEIKAFFYDVVNEPNGFDYVKTIGRGRYLAGGVLEGKLTMLLSEPEFFNNKEARGRLVVKSFTGNVFTTVNYIVAVEDQIYNYSNRGHSDGRYIYMGISEGSVKHSGVYRISSNGAIVNLGENTEYTTKNYSAVNNYYGKLITAGQHDDGTKSYFIAQKYDGSGDESDLGAWSEYITEFIGDPTVTKHLKEFVVAFTKTETEFNEEEFEIYYRTIDPYDIDDKEDETNSWTKFMVYDYDVDGQSDRKVQRHTSTQQLPEFKEIQFKIKARRGMNITKIKFKYEYISNE